jgi:hypothetical protein
MEENMDCTPPELVLSPKGRLKELKVVYNGGKSSWSLARMLWDGKKAVGIRWNGGSEDKCFPGIGNPQSRGVPTWFILPEEVEDVVLELVKTMKKGFRD